MCNWRSILFAIGCGLLVNAAAAAEPDEVPTGPRPRQIIEQTAQDVLAILRDSERNREERIAELDKVARARFDFRTMCRLVLARNWKKLSKRQQGDFVFEFTRYLANDYGSRLDRYQQQDVAVMSERSEPRGDVTVRTRVTGGDVEDAIIDYRMRYRNGEWRVIDVVIEGISMVANFRDQFREVLAREGVEGLLEKLREKNSSGDADTKDFDARALASPAAVLE